jgi:hypothetical protein
MHTWVAPLFYALGVLAVVWAVLAYRSERRFLRKARRVEGVVVGLNQRAASMSTIYFPVVRYTTAAGATLTTSSRDSKSKRSYPIGRAVPVLYDPDQPDRAEIDEFSAHWGIVTMAVIIALILFFIATQVLLGQAVSPLGL